MCSIYVMRASWKSAAIRSPACKRAIAPSCSLTVSMCRSAILEVSVRYDLMYLQKFWTQQCPAHLSADRQVARPRVAFASAAAVAAIVEGRPAAAETVAEEDGLAPVVNMLSTAGGLGKKAAAECLQVIPAFLELRGQPTVCFTRSLGGKVLRADRLPSSIVPSWEFMLTGPEALALTGNICRLALAAATQRLDAVSHTGSAGACGGAGGPAHAHRVQRRAAATPAARPHRCASGFSAIHV